MMSTRNRCLVTSSREELFGLINDLAHEHDCSSFISYTLIGLRRSRPAALCRWWTVFGRCGGLADNDIAGLLRHAADALDKAAFEGEDRPRHWARPRAAAAVPLFFRAQEQVAAVQS